MPRSRPDSPNWCHPPDSGCSAGTSNRCRTGRENSFSTSTGCGTSWEPRPWPTPCFPISPTRSANHSNQASMIPSIERLLQHITEFPVLGQFLISAICAALTEEWSTVVVFGLARAGKVGWGMALGSVFAGTVLLNTALWYAGRVAGHRALHWKMFSSLRRESMDALRHHVQRERWIAVAVARFVPGRSEERRV